MKLKHGHLTTTKLESELISMEMGFLRMDLRDLRIRKNRNNVIREK